MDELRLRPELRGTQGCHPAMNARSLMTSYKDERFWLFRPALSEFLITYPLYIDRAGYSRWREGREWSTPRSPALGVELVTAGNMMFEQDGRRAIVGPGEVFVARIGTRQHFRPGPAGFVHKRFVYLAGPLVDASVRTMGLQQVDTVRLTTTGRLGALIRHAYRTMACTADPLEQGMQLSTLALSVLLEVARHLVDREKSIEVRRALEFMHAHLHLPLTLAEIAKHSGLSPWYFARLFRSHTRQSPLKYFMRRRMEYAAHLLGSTELLIKEIAWLVGFDDQLHFSRQFRAQIGKSPRVYRRDAHGNPATPPGRGQQQLLKKATQ